MINKKAATNIAATTDYSKIVTDLYSEDFKRIGTTRTIFPLKEKEIRVVELEREGTKSADKEKKTAELDKITIIVIQATRRKIARVCRIAVAVVRIINPY